MKKIEYDFWKRSESLSLDKTSFVSFIREPAIGHFVGAVGGGRDVEVVCEGAGPKETGGHTLQI